jgi:hypothetical protein
MLRNSITVSTKQERIAALAKQSPQMAFTSLAYLMDIDWLKEAYTISGTALVQIRIEPAVDCWNDEQS